MKKRGEHPFGDAGQSIGFALFFIVWIADSFFLKYTLYLASYIPMYLRLLITLIAITVSLGLFQKSHKVVEGQRRPEKY